MIEYLRDVTELKQKKYYDIERKQKKKYRKKLFRTFRKNHFGTETVLCVVDAMSGDTPYGKERSSQEILRLLSDGAGEAEVRRYADSLTKKSFLHPVDDE